MPLSGLQTDGVYSWRKR